MNYRKLKADHLFTGSRLLGNNRVLITGLPGDIVAIVDEQDAGEGIETFQGILCPGFVNAHCHLELSHMLGLIPEKTGLVDFVYKVIRERYFPDEEIYNAILKTEDQMINGGIVAVGDICNTTLSLPQKRNQRLAYYNFIETSGWAPSVAGARWEDSRKVYDEFVKANLTAAIVPHAPYSVSNDLWKKIMPFFEHKCITIHNQESKFENELFLKGTGDLLRMYKMLNIHNNSFLPANKTSVQACFDNFAAADSLILVHNTFIGKQDIDFIKHAKHDQQLISFCLCPNANLYIEDTMPPVELLIDNNCDIILGTDSLASNRSIDMLDELKTIHDQFPLLSVETTLQWATLNGAKALQMDASIGSFDKAKMPGILLIVNTDGGRLTRESAVTRIL